MSLPAAPAPRRARALDDQIAIRPRSAFAPPWADPLPAVRFHRVAACRSLRRVHGGGQSYANSGILRRGMMSALGQKQTFAVHQPMSALAPKRHRLRFSACLLWANGGHFLVGTCEHRQWSCLGCFEIDHQLEFIRRLWLRPRTTDQLQGNRN
jgi:hypothetical protein